MARGDGSLAAIGRLRRLADALLKQKDEDAAWFKAALMVYEAGAGDGVTLCRAFGLAPTPGRDGWRSSEARSKRDALLCEIARRFYPAEASERCWRRQDRQPATAICRRRATVAPGQARRAAALRHRHRAADVVAHRAARTSDWPALPSTTPCCWHRR
jgi:hypothetical protein